MTIIRNIMIGSAGIAATLAVASPAAAQSYPYGYQNNSGGGIVGAIINSVTGYGQYPQGNYGYGQVNQRAAISQCAAAAEHRLNGNYRGQSGYGYQNGYNNNGYNNGYGNNGYQNGYGQQGGGRVLGITNVERRNNGGLKVTGVATSGQSYGAYGNQGYNNGYNNGYQNGYQNGYGQNGYAAQQQADLRFTCRVNLRGQVSDLRIERNRADISRLLSEARQLFDAQLQRMGRGLGCPRPFRLPPTSEYNGCGTAFLCAPCAHGWPGFG